MVVTSHFIDGDWTYQKKILNFCPIANHKGDTVGRAVELSLLKWGIDRLFTITTENASSNDVKKKTYAYALGYEFMHMRCCAHILNLIEQSGLKSIHESIAKVQNAMRYVRASPARFEEFQECVENEKIKAKKAKCLLSLDVPTRWNLTYLTLNCALKFVRHLVGWKRRMGITNFIFVKQIEMGKSSLVLLTILIGKMSRPL